MLMTQRVEKGLGYGQFGAGAVDAAVLLSTIPGGIPPGSVGAYISCEAQAIRWRDDATAPTTTVGFPSAVGAIINYTGPLAKLQLISQTAGAIVNVSFYGS